MAGTAEKLCHPGGWACWGISGPRAGWDPGSLGASLEAGAMGAGLVLGCQGLGFTETTWETEPQEPPWAVGAGRSRLG